LWIPPRKKKSMQLLSIVAVLFLLSSAQPHSVTFQWDNGAIVQWSDTSYALTQKNQNAPITISSSGDFGVLLVDRASTDCSCYVLQDASILVGFMFSSSSAWEISMACTFHSGCCASSFSSVQWPNLFYARNYTNSDPCYERTFWAFVTY